VLVTNLHNLTQPLIRYELTDRFTPAGTSTGGFPRASVEGRSDDVFRYGTATVHPCALTTALLRAGQVREYQVRQTAQGADITVVASAASTMPRWRLRSSRACIRPASRSRTS
jgi:phenylacetate-CoA ligase